VVLRDLHDPSIRTAVRIDPVAQVNAGEIATVASLRRRCDGEIDRQQRNQQDPSHLITRFLNALPGPSFVYRAPSYPDALNAADPFTAAGIQLD
jgi:hypothetical protein